MPFKTGPRFKYPNNPIIVELNAIGWNSTNAHRLLGCAPARSYYILLHPDELKMSQVKAISYAINKPLGYVLNRLFFTPSKSPNWLSEDYNPVEHISKLKGE